MRFGRYIVGVLGSDCDSLYAPTSWYSGLLKDALRSKDNQDDDNGAETSDPDAIV